MSQEDFNELLNAAVEHAATLLGEETEMAPFALAMQADDGELFHVEPDDLGDDAEPDEVLANVYAGLREEMTRWRAFAVVADVTLEDDEGELITAAIHVAMEHVAEDPIVCIVPYEIEGDELHLDELVVEPGERHVFAQPADA